MANRFKNEIEITLGQEKVLLRPTFENLSAMESNIGAVVWLSWKFSKAGSSQDMGEATRSMPSFTEMVEVIYYNQTERSENGGRRLSKERIWELMQDEGVSLVGPITKYFTGIMSGNKHMSPTSAEKKS
jgi:hypothetical protein